MKYNLYDFDGTVYYGDSSVDFFKFCLKKNKKIYKLIPLYLLACIKYFLKIYDITDFKQILFSFLKYVDDVDKEVELFWKNNNKIKKFYLKKDHKKDIIVSASPYFLLKPICDELKVKDLIASNVDKKTGKFLSANNSGINKVDSFRDKYPNAEILSMYSDRLVDKPLLDIAREGYIVKDDKIVKYEDFLNNNIIYRIATLIRKNRELISYLIVGGLSTIVSITTYGLSLKALLLFFNEGNILLIAANIISWIITVIFAYFTNRKFVFESHNTNIKEEFLKFTGSRIFTLLLETATILLLKNTLKISDMVSKIIAQVIVVIGNYIISKLIVFKKK